MALITKGQGMEDSGVRLKALLVTDEDNGAELTRLRDHNGVVIQAYPMLKTDLSSITYKVFDKGATGRENGTQTGTGTVAIATAIFDELQLGGWPADGVGWNFAFTVPAADLPTGDHWYWVEFKFTPATGQAWFERFEVFINAVETS